MRTSPTSCPLRRPVRRREDGFSLIEVLVATLLIATVVLALVTGLLTLVRTTESNNQRQQVQLALGNFSESVTAMPYHDCTTGTADETSYWTEYQSGAASWQPERDGMTAQIIDVEYWNPTTRTFVPACAATDHGAQQLTLEVSWRGRTDTTQTVIGDR